MSGRGGVAVVSSGAEAQGRALVCLRSGWRWWVLEFGDYEDESPLSYYLEGAVLRRTLPELLFTLSED